MISVKNACTCTLQRRLIALRRRADVFQAEGEHEREPEARLVSQQRPAGARRGQEASLTARPQGQKRTSFFATPLRHVCSASTTK